jgi:hypothetical protein
MGASAVLGLAVLASYGALAAVALSAVGGGSVLSFPGWAVDAIIQVNAAPPQHTAQYGAVTATPTPPTKVGRANVVTPRAPAAGTTVAVSTSGHGGPGSSQGGSGPAGGSGSGSSGGGSSAGLPTQPPLPARHRMCERHAWRFHHRCIHPDRPGRRHHDHHGPDSDHHHAWHHPPRHGQSEPSHRHHHAWHHPPRHGQSEPSHRHHHAWHHPPRHGQSEPSHHHHAWHHPPRHGHHRHGGSSEDTGSHHHGGHHDGGSSDDTGSHHHGGHHHGGSDDNGSGGGD